MNSFPSPHTCLYATTSELMNAAKLETVSRAYLSDVVVVSTLKQSRFIKRGNGVLIAAAVVWCVFCRFAAPSVFDKIDGCLIATETVETTKKETVIAIDDASSSVNNDSKDC